MRRCRSRYLVEGGHTFADFGVKVDVLHTALDKTDVSILVADGSFYDTVQVVLATGF